MSLKEDAIVIGMVSVLLFLLVLFLIPSVMGATVGCGTEVERATDCVIRTPPVGCSTYSIWNSTMNITHDGIAMEEIPVGTGIHNFTFNANGTGIHSIVLCDNTSSQLLVQNTDKTDLTTILANQATLADNIMTVNDTVKLVNISILENISRSTLTSSVDFTEVLGAIETTNDTVLLINTSILENISVSTLTTDLTEVLEGLFTVNETVLLINTSITENISRSAFSSSVSEVDQIAIGNQCALQTLGQNYTILYGYNRSNFFLRNITYNYTGLGFLVNESYTYDDESFLNITERISTKS